MLDIIIDGLSIDLPDDISVDLVIENPFMIQDRIPTAFSLTFSLPNTPRNLARFHYPNRINTQDNFEPINGVSILIDGLGISSGQLILDTFDEVINAYFVGSAFVPHPDVPVYNIEMAKYTLDPCISPAEVQTQTGFYPSFKNLLAATLLGTEKFVCPPVRVINDKQFKPFDPDPEGDGSSVYMKFQRLGLSENRSHLAQFGYLNFWNVNLSAWRYVDQHMCNIYFPFVWHIFDVTFKNMIRTNLFREGELAKLIMINLFHPQMTGWFASTFRNGCVFDNSLGGNTPYFKLNTSCPDYEIGSFLKDLLKLFCISIFADNKGGYVMAFNRDLINSSVTEDWTRLVTGKYLSVSKRAGQHYGYGYSSVLEDVQEEGTEVSSHLMMTGIPAESLPTQVKVVNTGEIYKVSLLDYSDDTKLPPNTNCLVIGRYYKVIDDVVKYNGNDWKPVNTVFRCVAGQLSYAADKGRVVDVSPDMYVYECINQGLGGSSDGEYAMVSEVTPLPMSVEKYWCDDPTPRFGQWLVPVVTEPRYERPKTPHIGIYHGMRKAFNNVDQYPCVSSRNYDTQGVMMGNLSLDWGYLIDQYHKEFKAWIEKDKKAVTAVMRLDALSLKNLDFKIKKNIHGVNFWVEKVSVSIKKERIELAQVDLVEC